MSVPWLIPNVLSILCLAEIRAQTASGEEPNFYCYTPPVCSDFESMVHTFAESILLVKGQRLNWGVFCGSSSAEGQSNSNKHTNACKALVSCTSIKHQSASSSSARTALENVWKVLSAFSIASSLVVHHKLQRLVLNVQPKVIFLVMMEWYQKWMILSVISVSN